MSPTTHRMVMPLSYNLALLLSPNMASGYGFQRIQILAAQLVQNVKEWDSEQETSVVS